MSQFEAEEVEFNLCKFVLYHLGLIEMREIRLLRLSMEYCREKAKIWSKNVERPREASEEGVCSAKREAQLAGVKSSTIANRPNPANPLEVSDILGEEAMCAWERQKGD